MKPYSIKWETNTFTMTKKFAEEASKYGTEAYNLLMDVRGKGFHIVVRQNEKPRKACPTRITYEQMENFLSCLDYADERLEQLHTVIAASKGQHNRYEYVRKWFLENYPDFREIPILDVNCRIVAPRVKLLPEAVSEMKAIA